MNDTKPLSHGTLAELLHFYAEAGLDFAYGDVAEDQFNAQVQAKAPSPAPRQAPAAGQRPAPQRTTQEARAPVAAPPMETVLPDSEAVQAAIAAASACESMDDLVAAVNSFTGCNLSRSARQPVVEGGRRGAPLMIISGAPTRDDDLEAIAWSGIDGILLRKMLAAIGLDYEADVYAGFCVPWATPGGEPPTPLHLSIAAPFMQRQIALARPQIILALGNTAAQSLFASRKPITLLRGQLAQNKAEDHEFQLVATYDPTNLRRNPLQKRQSWQDLLLLKEIIAAQ